MPVAVGTAAVTDVRLGTTAVQSVRVGTTVAWSRGGPAAQVWTGSPGTITVTGTSGQWATSVVTDNFNRADGELINPPWVTIGGSYGVLGNKVAITVINYSSYVFYNAAAIGNDQYAELDSSASGAAGNDRSIGPATRMSGPEGNDYLAAICYYAWVNAAVPQAEIWRKINADYIMIGTPAPLTNLTPRLRLESIGNVHKLYIDESPTPAIVVSNSEIASGKPGIVGHSPSLGLTGDNFEAGNLNASGQTWVGSPGTITVTGTSGAWAPHQAWAGSAGTITIAGTSGTWSVTNNLTWTGSAGTIAITGTSGTWAAAQVWTGSAGTITITGTSGTWSVVSAGDLYTDNFNRSNGAIGGGWEVQWGSALIDTNRVACTPTNGHSVDWAAWSNGNDQYSDLDITTASWSAGGSIGPSVRVTPFPSASDQYYVWLNGVTGKFDLYRVASNVYTAIASSTASLAAGRCRVQAVGSTLKVFLNGTEVISTTDSTLPTGKPGITAYTGDVLVAADNWAAGIP